MIAHIEGKVSEKFLNSIIVDVNGVGYELGLSKIDAETTNVGEQKKFYTYHAIRETSEDLYGFSSIMAKKIFELLISVNSIGPKAAMSILSLANPEEVRNAIANADVVFISKASGIGKKSAERVIVDLKDKVGLPTAYKNSETINSQTKQEDDEALDALMALGYTLKEATFSLSKIDPSLSTEEKIRQALKNR